MASNIIVADAEFKRTVGMLSDGAAELQEIMESYYNVLSYVRENGIIDVAIGNELAEKMNAIRQAANLFVPCVETVRTATVGFLDDIAEKDNSL